MFHTSTEQIGFSLKLGKGAFVNFGEETGIFALTNSELALVFNIVFQGNAENQFLGGDDGGNQSMILSRNDGGSLDNSIRLVLTDDGGDQRDVTWVSAIPPHEFRNVILEFSAEGAGGINLFINGELQDIAAETHDAGFNPEGDIFFKIGELDSAKTGRFWLARFSAYSRTTTVAEKALIQLGNYPETPESTIMDYQMQGVHRGLNETLPTLT